MVELSKLKKAEDCVKRLLGVITPSQLIQLATEGVCPHYVLRNPANDEESILFVPQEIYDWYTSNHVRVSRDCYQPEIKFISMYEPPDVTKMPRELMAIKNIEQLPVYPVGMQPGIYFLCLDDKIMYIGQSTNVNSRIAAHIGEGKKSFNSAYFIPYPKSLLDALECILIDKYKPELNGNYGITSSLRDCNVTEIEKSVFCDIPQQT